MAEFYMLDGQPVDAMDVVINSQDQGLLYGFNLFETMLVRHGQIVLLWPHLDRMACSAQELGLMLPCDTSELAQMCQYAADLTCFELGVLRVTVTAGANPSGKGHSIITVKQGLPYTREQYVDGVALWQSDFPRNEKSPLVRHKTGNYLENLLARQVARHRGCVDAVFCNTRGQVAECTASNIFMVQKNNIITPPVAAGLLPGITRRQVLDLSPKAGISCKQANFYPGDLAAADECFITNSIMGIMPVTSLNGRFIGRGQTGPLTKKIMAMYEKMIS